MGPLRLGSWDSGPCSLMCAAVMPFVTTASCLVGTMEAPARRLTPRAPPATFKAKAGLAASSFLEQGVGELAAPHEQGTEQARLPAKAQRASTHAGIPAEAPRLRGDSGAELHPAAPDEFCVLGRAERCAYVDGAGHLVEGGRHSCSFTRKETRQPRRGP